MLSYCFKCRKNTESKTQRVANTRKEKPMHLSKCTVWDSKKSKFIKTKEAE